VPADELAEFERLARSAHRTSLMVNHYEDLRGLLASWRYLHRWVALLMVLLLVAHVVTAWRYADLGGGAP
jgi:predicted ferric reductase